MRVVIAMSGGVDSSVAAALLKNSGYDVIGITMQLWPRSIGADNAGATGCCGLDAIDNARRVAYRLGIPHYVMDFRDVFAGEVIDDFCREYRRGRTPNPCIRCNERIKFGVLREKACKLDAECIATGHYARIELDESSGDFRLKKGRDPHKDQSYFLYPLAREQLARTLFPVGHLEKKEVRRLAGEFDLPVADRPESQEICFVPDNDHGEFIRSYIPCLDETGPILDRQGRTLGSHRGIIDYTVGQRHGLGIAAARPLYVTEIRPEDNTVIVGPKEQTYGRELVAADLNWLITEPPDTPLRVKAKIRYRHPEAPATVVRGSDGEYYVNFDEPQPAITPGQAVVFYEGDVVLGGGTIARQGK